MWLVAAVAFGVCVIGAVSRQAWWLPMTFGWLLFSLVLCIIGWPDSRIGVFFDLVILVALLLGRRYFLFIH